MRKKPIHLVLNLPADKKGERGENKTGGEYLPVYRMLPCSTYFKICCSVPGPTTSSGEPRDRELDCKEEEVRTVSSICLV